MNVYSINPYYVNEDNFSYFLDILKIKKVISLTNQIPSVCEPLLICRYTNDDKFIKRAVHKFNEPICTPRYTNGNWAGDFIVHDKYKESRSYNPIYNLEYCNDENVLVLAHNEWEYEKFIKYALNLLKKYANKFHYESKICFIYFQGTNGSGDISLFISPTLMYYNGVFKSLLRYQPFRSDMKSNLKEGCSYSAHNIQNWYNVYKYGLVYDPILSYINKKLKELLPKDRIIDLVDFLGGRSILDCFLDNSLDNRDAYSFSDNSSLQSTIEAELEYIRNNGGDWIDY